MFDSPYNTFVIVFWGCIAFVVLLAIVAPRFVFAFAKVGFLVALVAFLMLVAGIWMGVIH